MSVFMQKQYLKIFAFWILEILEMLKNSPLFTKKKQTLLVNNSRILAIRNAKSLGRYFYMNLNIIENYQAVFISLYFP